MNTVTVIILVILNICLILIDYYVLFVRKTPKSVVVWGASLSDSPGYISLYTQAQISTTQDQYIRGLDGCIGKIRIEHFPDTTEEPRKFLIVALED